MPCSAACMCLKGMSTFSPTRPPTPSSARLRIAARTASPISGRTARSISSMSAFFKTLVNGLTDAKIQQIVIDASKVFYRLYGDIYHELSTRHPVKSHAA